MRFILKILLGFVAFKIFLGFVGGIAIMFLYTAYMTTLDPRAIPDLARLVLNPLWFGIAALVIGLVFLKTSLRRFSPYIIGLAFGIIAWEFGYLAVVAMLCGGQGCNYPFWPWPIPVPA